MASGNDDRNTDSDAERLSGIYRSIDGNKVFNITETSSPTSTVGSNNSLVRTHKDGEVDVEREKWWQTLIQVTIPYLIAGVGSIGVGVILGSVKRWEVFVHVTELFILLPAVLGLKGNLDMTFAARLSTQANLGNFSEMKEIIHMVIGNFSIVQTQSCVASFILSWFSIGVGVLLDGNFDFSHALLVTAVSMFTTSTSCLIMSFLLVALILFSHKFNINPDNIATPLAASFGDVIAIILLSSSALFLYNRLNSNIWIPYVVIACYFAALPFWIILVLRNRYTRPLLKSGWAPILIAMFMSGGGGIVLEYAVDAYYGFAVFQSILNGNGGNLGAVYASRVSTVLYQKAEMGKVPTFTRIFETPWRVMVRGTPYAKCALILILMSIPAQVIFIFSADVIHQRGQVTIGAAFVFSYLLAHIALIVIILYVTHVLAHSCWKFNIDPDSGTIPIVTALADLVGSGLLLLTFMFLKAIGRPYHRRDVNQPSYIIKSIKFL